MSPSSNVASLRREEAHAQPASVSVSERIRARLLEAGQRFHANDNIAAFIAPGELDELREEVAACLHELQRSLVIDTEHDHNSADTARRVAKLYLDEVFAGRYQAPPRLTAFPNDRQLNELMVVGPIRVRSACSHHLCPIQGKVWIGVLPSAQSELIGLSKYARLCDWIMRRPQIQEEAVVMLADELERHIRPDGLGVVMEADHLCMQWRGVEDDGAMMRSTVMRGALREDRELRREFLAMIGKA